MALRGLERGESYCSCPDYRKNTLGTCKHIMRVTATVRRKFSAGVLSKPFEPDELAVYVRYGDDLELRLQQPRHMDRATRRRFRRYLGRPIAGATGLNLQSANTVVNVDLPWNPAVLEQRIGRAQRMGQRRPVHVYLLVTEQTIEENMLRTLALKKDLAGAVPESHSRK